MNRQPGTARLAFEAHVRNKKRWDHIVSPAKSIQLRAAPAPVNRSGFKTISSSRGSLV